MVAGYFTLSNTVAIEQTLFNVSGIDLSNYGFVAKYGSGDKSIYSDSSGNIKTNEEFGSGTYYINAVFATVNQ